MKKLDKLMASIIRSGKKGLTFLEIKKILRLKGSDQNKMKNALTQLIATGKLTVQKNRYISSKTLGLYPAQVIRNKKTFCIVRRLSDNAEIFIPGRHSYGALTDDKVLVKPERQQGTSEEGKIITVTDYGPSTFSGVLRKNGEQYYVLPDHIARESISAVKPPEILSQPGDKVIAKVTKRGKHHADHKCEIISSFGSAHTAAACSEAILEAKGISAFFPSEVTENARRIAQKGISDIERNNRLDLTDIPIFTIDGADSKDLDDAVSLDKDNSCYHLGVHIADVSYYVKFRSALDTEAYERGTSIYYADKVIPMLPKELSNGICSLNPGEQRLAFSALMDISFDGKLMNFEFKKTVISSRVKGVYSEINQILEGIASDEIMEKYNELLPQINLMHELYKILLQNKIKRGAPQIQTSESKISVGQDGAVEDITPRIQGVAEGIIEEFMLLANEAAATFAKREKLPFIYRVHERPTPEKVVALKQILQRLGIDSRKVEPKMKPAVLAGVLNKAKDTSIFQVVNTQVLRSMAKAKYSDNPIGHFGLALKDYSHFTSPIRRYPDLVIHRILNDYLVYRDSMQIILSRYDKFVALASTQATKTEVSAMQIERECEDCYKAEYMSGHLGEEFDGIISTVLDRGIYVQLENTVEGYVKIESLSGEYDYDGFIEIRNTVTGVKFRVGQSVKVRCIAADVNSGNIDFELIQENNKGEEDENKNYEG